MKFIKKPIPIEAVKCVPENFEEIVTLLKSGCTEWEPLYIKSLVGLDILVGFDIHSWEGIDPVYLDPARNKDGKVYWIMKGIKGEIYPCVADDVDDAPLGYTAVEE